MTEKEKKAKEAECDRNCDECDEDCDFLTLEFDDGATVFSRHFLVGQGAKSFEIWTGMSADRAAMLAALR